MPASKVNLGGLPLTRANPWYPGQMGVPGTDTETGLRTHPTGTIFYVDPNYPGASDARDGTNPTDPMLTVQGAVNKCQDYRGDVIIVNSNSAWQYASALVDYKTPIREEIVLNKSGVRLIGVAPFSSVGVVWEPVTAAGAGTCITVTGCDCLIEGFAFQGGAVGGRAIYAEWDGIAQFADNLTVRHCFFDNDIDIGIQLEYVWYGEVSDCYFVGCDAYGIYVDAAGSGVLGMVIRDNIFRDCGTTMLALLGADECEVFNNSFYNTQAQVAAVATDMGLVTTGGQNNQIYDNYFSCLLPVPANGDWDDLNTGAATDAWIGNHVMNGLAITNPT